MKKVYTYLTAILIGTNFIVLLCLLKMEDCDERQNDKYNLVVHSDGLHSNLWHEESDTTSNSLTVIIRNFEMFSNDLNNTVNSIYSVVPDSMTFIISDQIPYPPLKFDEKLRVTVVITKVKPDYESHSQFHISKLQSQIKTKFVLLIPDGIWLEASELEKMKQHSKTYPNDIIASRVMGESIKCLSATVDFKSWTVVYKEIKKSLDVHHQLCDSLSGSPILLIPKKLLFSLTHPFALPMPQALFLQTSYKKAKVILSNDVIFKKTGEIFSEPKQKWKLQQLTETRLGALYHDFGIKKVVLADGTVHWYGCTKETSRCFGTVIDSKPDYLYERRHTPPCCLEALRITARHVFKVLTDCNVKYWLEGGSLLGAARNGDIIPWDYDVDIGIYKEDIEKCIWLKQIDNIQNKPLIDDDGFIWERAIEGDFFRVQYSITNRLHVDIFPFYVRDGIMTKDTWFKTHKQDCEFPENFLKPLSTIQFVGVNASAPNNVTEFLEFKFGKGVIENPVNPIDSMKNFTNLNVQHLPKLE